MPKVTFVYGDGEEKTVEAPVGISLLEVAHQNEIPLEGACEGSLACSTCHVVVDDAWFSKLKAAEEAEEDMLDMAFGLTKTSRLGCQILMSDELDGLKVYLPDESRHLAFD
ncbi:MAG: 2Fe-2S iron-sulfur cluster binding domain-containing protein [Alphaproteobacteria bacterium]|nr:MAG: 2Fe-2S iron-sulfur cluster binding domain-containing protein [Alphaproteobacteria bacterium]